MSVFKNKLRELEPLTGILCAVRIKLKNKDSYAGIGTLSLGKDGTIDLAFEWIVLLLTNSFGEDEFHQDNAIAALGSLREKAGGYTMNFKPKNLDIGECPWQKIFTDEGSILISFDERQTELVENIRSRYVGRHNT